MESESSVSGKTPGQAAYEAFWTNRPPVTGTATAIPADWDGEPPAVRAQWEAAAQAAIGALTSDQPKGDAPDLITNLREELADVRDRAEWYESERNRLRALVAELGKALAEAARHVEPVDQNSELAIGEWQALAAQSTAQIAQYLQTEEIPQFDRKDEPAIATAGTEHLAAQLAERKAGA